MTSYPNIDRAHFRAFLKDKPLADVVAAAEGRFILPVPDLQDGLGPLLVPNIKELEARLRGSEGKVSAIELEAGPQKIPADGTNLIVINRVDEFVQLALKAKFTRLTEKAGGITREVLTEFMSYARGYTYDADKQTISFTKSAGFHNDVYNMPVEEFRRRYVSFEAPEKPLDDVKDTDIKPGYYVKKALHSRAAFITGKFSVRVGGDAGGTVQEFDKGAMINIPDDPALPLSFIHPTDIDISYRKDGGASLYGTDGKLSLPVYDAGDIKPAASAARPPKAAP